MARVWPDNRLDVRQRDPVFACACLPCGERGGSRNMANGRARVRARLTVITVRLAMVAALAVVAITATVAPAPGRAHSEPSASPPAPVAFGASKPPHTGCVPTPPGDIE